MFAFNAIFQGLAHWRWHADEIATRAEKFWLAVNVLAAGPAILCGLGLYGFSAGGDLLAKGIALFLAGCTITTGIAFFMEGGEHNLPHHMPFAQQATITNGFWFWLWWYTARFARLVRGLKEA